MQAFASGATTCCSAPRADPVFVARCGKRLPTTSRISGGLEEPNIREAGCAILGGGKRDFQEPARQLRVTV